VPVRIALNARELAAHPLRIGLSTTVKVDISKTDGAMLGSPMPQAPIYSTSTLAQPLPQASAAADSIIARNLVH
jgi:membrane fusion protein (multidrug efflux system)